MVRIKSLSGSNGVSKPIFKPQSHSLTTNSQFTMEHRVSNSQLEELLDYLATHPALAKGVGLGARSKENIDREWSDIAQKLNAHGSGATKNGQRWKRYWADLKHKAKSRAAAKRRDNTGTGGGPSIIGDLSEADQKILSIIGEAAVYGDIEHRVPVFEIQKEPFPELLSKDIVIKLPEPLPSCSSEQILTSPSKSGQTSQKYCQSPTDSENVRVQPTIQFGTESPKSSRPQLKRSLLHDSKPNKSSKSRDQTKVEPAWVVELERKRIEVEEKIANAAMIMAEAAHINAESARRNVECMRMHCEIMIKLIDALKK